MEILEIADKLTDIVFYGDGVADTAKAIFEAMEKMMPTIKTPFI